MKYIRSIVLFAILALFPAISWYYLQSGLDWRKDMYKELQSDNRAAAEVLVSDALQDRIKNKTSLLVYDDRYKADIDLIHEQFEGSYTYQKLDIQKSDLRSPNGFAMLVDTAGIVKYEYTDQDQMKKIVQHMSLVIPKEPERDIILKTNNGR